MNAIWTTLTGTGGLLRVRSALALGLTGIGGAYLLLNQALPPGEYNVIWASAIAWYFGTRAKGS